MATEAYFFSYDTNWSGKVAGKALLTIDDMIGAKFLSPEDGILPVAKVFLQEIDTNFVYNNQALQRNPWV